MRTGFLTCEKCGRNIPVIFYLDGAEVIDFHNCDLKNESAFVATVKSNPVWNVDAINKIFTEHQKAA